VRIALTIAGSDSGGGAGIQADLKTFHQFEVFGTSVITAITAQNTLGVRRWEPVSPELVRDQLDAVVDDLKPDAFKSGMLGNTAIVRTIAKGIAEHGLENYVLDPVMVAASGDVLLENDAIAVVRDELVPLCTVVTPNLDEAGLLLGERVSSLAEMRRAAERLVHDLGAKAAVVKGGHMAGDELVDVFYTRQEELELRHQRVDTTSTHGTGCTLSAAIAAELARGTTLRSAVESAVDFVHRAIEAAPHLGAGHGPLNHFVDALGVGAGGSK
jgi:hydroxymethylpyrimidine/phosphomethylpyrimidine kinase